MNILPRYLDRIEVTCLFYVDPMPSSSYAAKVGSQPHIYNAIAWSGMFLDSVLSCMVRCIKALITVMNALTDNKVYCCSNTILQSIKE